MHAMRKSNPQLENLANVNPGGNLPMLEALFWCTATPMMLAMLWQGQLTPCNVATWNA